MMNPRMLKDMADTIDKAQRICFFGIGALISDCYDQLVLFLRREPDFLCDNAQEKWGTEFFGKKCISPYELGALRDNTVVIITIRNYEDIYAQLKDMGIKDIFVSCYDRCYDTVCSIRALTNGRQTESVAKSSPVSVKGKWTLVTGASRGVGYQIALEMAKLGSNIIAHSRSVSHVRKLVDMCSALGVDAVPIAAEFSNLTEVDTMLSGLEHMVPQIDIMFNNAAISPSWPSGFWSSPSQDYLDTYIINTIAPIRVCQRLIPAMIRQGFGRVINISSTIQRRAGEMAYACSKAALDKFVYDLAPSLEGTGVMMSLVCPGYVRSDMGGIDAPRAVESVIPGVLLGALLDGDINGRWFSAQDYAGLSLSAAIKKANFITAKRTGP